jgi:hypothetical protein
MFSMGVTTCDEYLVILILPQGPPSLKIVDGIHANGEENTSVEGSKRDSHRLHQCMVSRPGCGSVGIGELWSKCSVSELYHTVTFFLCCIASVFTGAAAI